ncbi:MAG: discoidin domain-containing protein [Planctomycetota bacterium]
MSTENGIDSGVLHSGSVAFGKKAKASNVYRKSAAYGPAKALDDDPETRWATDAGTQAAWLEVDLGEPTALGRAVIREAYAGRVRQFELQVKEGEGWRTIARGTTLGEHREVRFPSVTARIVRLNILKATDGPTIWEFQLFPPKK